MQGSSPSPPQLFEAVKVARGQGNLLAFCVGLNFSLLPAPCLPIATDGQRAGTGLNEGGGNPRSVVTNWR